jgi:L-rhamnose mutarotase
MIRHAFTMRLKPDGLAQYKQQYDSIWPELVAQLERSGIASITTFQRDLDLFLVSEIADEAAWDTLWNSEVYKRWTAMLEPLMHVRPDGVIEMGELTEVFHISTNGNGRGAAADAMGGQRPRPSEANEAPREMSSESAGETSMADNAPPAAAQPVEMSPAEPAPKAPAKRAKKRAVKKPARKKAAPAKKSKGKTAKRPKVRAARKGPKKSAKKATRKKSAPKKAKAASRKKRPAKKRG